MSEMNIGVTLSRAQANPPKVQGSYTMLAGTTCGKCYLNADGDIILPKGESPVHLRFELTQAELPIDGVAHKLSFEAGAFVIKSTSNGQFPSSGPETSPTNSRFKVEATNSDGQEHAYTLKVVAKSSDGGSITLDLDPKIKNGGTTLRGDGCTFGRDDLMGLTLVLISALALVAILGCVYFVRNWRRHD